MKYRRYAPTLTAKEKTARRTAYMKIWRARKRALGDSYVPIKRNPSPTPEQRKAWWSNYAKANAAKLKALGRDYRERLKADVIARYGGVCACCGEDELAFLTIDHIKPARGNRHLRSTLYHALLKNDFPPGYQVLCFNCNCAKRTGDECPHRLIVRRKLMLMEPGPL